MCTSQLELGRRPDGRAKREKAMQNVVSQRRRCMLAGMLGAVGGGLAVALAARAIPRLVSQTMSGMMQAMMAQMAEECGASPQEM